jgi:hypothetical protein
LRITLSAVASMLGLIELGHKLTKVRPPPEFDAVAFQHIRRNFQRLVDYFNELASLTGQDLLQVENSPPPAIVTSIVASIESENNRL